MRAQIIHARRQFERQAIDISLLKTLYCEYTDIPHPSAFIKTARIQFPKLNCGVASVYLRHVLGCGTIIRGSYKDNNHTVLLVDDRIVDITADQYGGPKVYVGPIKKPWSAKQTTTAF